VLVLRGAKTEGPTSAARLFARDVAVMRECESLDLDWSFDTLATNSSGRAETRANRWDPVLLDQCGHTATDDKERFGAVTKLE
jgi:hypothetical protein